MTLFTLIGETELGTTQPSIRRRSVSGDGALRFPSPRARQLDPQTSHRAAVRAEKVIAGRRLSVLKSLYTHGPASGSELDQHLCWLNNTAVRLLSDLRKRGFIEKVGERPTPTTGSDAQVYRITAFGHECLTREGMMSASAGGKAK